MTFPFAPGEPEGRRLPAVTTTGASSFAETEASRSERAKHLASEITEHSATIRILMRVLPFVGLAFSIILVAWGLHSGVLKSMESLRAFIASLGIWGPIVFMAASFSSVMFPIIPAGLLVISAPVLFGPVEGTIYNWISVCAGSLANFAVARAVGLPLIHAMFKDETVEKYLGWTRRPGFANAFATAIVLPVAPDDLLCYLAGTTKMSWARYTLIILLGKIPSLVAYGLGVSALLTAVIPW